MPYPHLVVDVFTDRPLAGNPLAVVLDAGDLPGAAMQAIAREFNLSETVFVAAGATPGTHTVRIFTPTAEIPFAGHPTIGAAVVIASLTGSDAELTLLAPVGPVRCRVQVEGRGAGSASFELPAPATFATAAPPPTARLAQLIGVAHEDVGFAAHVPAIVGAGFEFMFVPLARLEALAAVELATGLWADVLPAPLPAALVAYAPAEGSGRAYRLRVFAPPLGIPEDPATGSAAAAFSGVLAAFAPPPDGTHAIELRQGVEMGRPSLISLELRMRDGRAAGGRVGGHVVRVAEGLLHV